MGHESIWTLENFTMVKSHYSINEVSKCSVQNMYYVHKRFLPSRNEKYIVWNKIYLSDFNDLKICR